MMEEKRQTGLKSDWLKEKTAEIKKQLQEIDRCRVLKGKGFLLAKKNLSEEAFRMWVEETLGFTMAEARDYMRFAEEVARRSQN